MRIQRLIHYALLAAGLCASLSGSGQTPGAGGNKDQTYHVQVEMVSLPVVVTDRDGNHPKDLKLEDFRVIEDGIPQDIAGFAAVEEPISVALMLDVSGSTEYQLQRIRDEAIRFVNILRPDDSIAILSVADHVKLLEQFSLYHKKNPEKIRQIQSGGLSAVYEGVAFALEKVLKLEYGRKALVFFSDGVDNRSRDVTEEDTLELARQTDAPIYCIYFNTSQDPMSGDFQPFPAPGRVPPIGFPRKRPKRPEYAAGRGYMEQLSQLSGGILLDAARIENLGSSFRRIANELSCQYSIGYYPKNLKYESRFRQIEVKTARPGLVVRTRRGYYHEK